MTTCLIAVCVFFAVRGAVAWRLRPGGRGGPG